jgi:hypothetical protein
MADNSNRLAGVAYVTVDGAAYAIAGDGTYRTSSVSRETLMGQDGYHGVKEMPTAGRIAWRGRDGQGVSIQTLSDSANVTVVLELANGKTIIGRNMTRVGEPLEVNTEEATFDIAWEGPDVSEN